MSGICRNVARALRLNEDLAEAIALGHDLGHAPFGHTGEEALDRCSTRDYGRDFRHNEHSLRIVDVLEHDGRGLNLTEEVRDGILNHTGDVEPATLEGAIVRLVDRFAYVNHDIDDARAGGHPRPGRLPAGPIAPARRDLVASGSTRSSTTWSRRSRCGRRHRPVRRVRDGAAGAARVHVRRRSTWARSRARETGPRGATMVEELLATSSTPDELPRFDGDPVTRATDWVAGMTDGYALRAHAELARRRVTRIAARASRPSRRRST